MSRERRIRPAGNGTDPEKTIAAVPTSLSRSPDDVAADLRRRREAADQLPPYVPSGRYTDPLDDLADDSRRTPFKDPAPAQQFLAEFQRLVHPEAQLSGRRSAPSGAVQHR